MLTFLIVEDEARIRDLFTQFLKMKGYRIIEAKDGQEAVEAVRQQFFDLVIMDVKMPRVGGIDALRQIRMTSPSTKVLFITGFGLTEEIEAVLQEGIVECIRKPFTFEQLITTVQRITTVAPRSGSPPSAAAASS